MMKQLLIILALVSLSYAQSTGSGGSTPPGLAIGNSGRSPNGLTVVLTPTSVAVGQTATVTANLAMNDGSSDLDISSRCVLSSSDGTIATVPAQPVTPNGASGMVGTVTGVAAGTATITCAYNGFTASATITVTGVIAITSPVCAAQPCILPNGSNGTAYSFGFLQSGGALPVTWSVSVGSFAACGVSINASTGVLSGSATTCANDIVTMRVTDNAANHKDVQVQLTVIASLCGPNATTPSLSYPCSSSNITAAVALPVSVPFTGLTGANTCVATPEPGNPGGILNAPLCRVTDSTSISTPLRSAVPNRSGAGFDLSWNTNSTWMVYGDDGANTHFVSVTPNSYPTPPSFAASTGVRKVFSGVNWSTVTALKFYYLSNAAATNKGTQIRFQNPADGTFASTTVFDFATCPGLPATYVFPTDPIRTNNGDTLFADGLSITGAQDSLTNRVVAAYVAPGGFVPTGCYWVNTSTGQMFGPGGLIGHYNVSHGTFYSHQIAAARGNAVIIQPANRDSFKFTSLSNNGTVTTANYTQTSDGTQMISGETFVVSGTTAYNGTFALTSAGPTQVQWAQVCAGCIPETSGTATVVTDRGSDPWLWIPGQTDIHALCNTALSTICSGHWVGGNTHFYNNAAASSMAQKPFATPGTLDFTFPSPNPCGSSHFDSHPNLNANWPDNSFLGIGTFNNTIDYTLPCMSEIILQQISGSIENMKRFSHTYENYSWDFSCDQNIVAFSQDGRFASFCSNMNGNLGDVAGNPTCTQGTKHGGAVNTALGGNCRDDLFVVDLRGQ